VAYATAESGLKRFIAPLLIGSASLLAHDPITTKLTWSQEISRIFYKRCVSCHREGGSAPMSLVTYEEARPWAKAIRDEVLGRSMPPWGAVKGFGDFLHDPSLTQDEMNRIAQWVEGGAPEGEAIYLPPLPPVPEPEPLAHGEWSRRLAFPKSASVLAIRPLADTASGQVIAVRPDGSREPLLWLLKYEAAWNRAFVFREPINLPAGSRIDSGGVAVELLIKAPSPAH
jgi:hypothetical protein